MPTDRSIPVSVSRSVWLMNKCLTRGRCGELGHYGGPAGGPQHLLERARRCLTAKSARLFSP